MKKVGLFGNPNTGKSSLFNRLTGLKQRVGNFPGVTVDKQLGKLKFGHETVQIIDFPGTYSIYPRSADEQVVYKVISNPNHADYPDLALVVVDASNLERNLLLFSQIYDLGVPTVLVLNLTDVASKNGLVINIDQLQSHFPNTTIIRSNARVGLGMNEIHAAISQLGNTGKSPKSNSVPLIAMDDPAAQSTDTTARFERIKRIVADVVTKKENPASRQFSSRLDRWLVHPVLGYVIFFTLLLVIFQTVFSLAAYPMDWIDMAFANLSEWTAAAIPEGLFSRLLTEAIIPGIGGVLIFIPQIGLLFLLISILEETGYMARVVFIMDKLMRPFGLNGKSVVPLISSAACAIPGVMATRTIQSWNERLTTILVAPLMSCSARIPVYTLLIALVIPDQKIWGFLNLQGLVLFGMYALGLVMALLVALVIKQFFRKRAELSVFLLELPAYKAPRWANVGLEVFQKVKLFVLDAGKIILAISIVLWALASFGPGDNMEKAAAAIEAPADKNEINVTAYEDRVAAAKLEHSYMGILGKTIEPVIRPLGYDWKMGISLLTSFAAREVFVGSLATIYSVHQEDDDPKPLIDRLRSEKYPDGKPVYTLASGVSLLVFYAFAMQCMATLAVVKRETKSWKWPLIQLGYMGVLAYLGAFIAYQLLK
ncbi:MAG TPA: ferrous iron transport protein B [Fluviicola sp.]|nr:ferrous iron transport protein B [Fluviicola sp.]